MKRRLHPIEQHALPSTPSTPALAVRQPWAWMIVHGGKSIENRTWAITYRGPLYIYASRRMTMNDYRSGKERFYTITGDLAPQFYSYSRGAIVGIVDLVDIVTESGSPWFDGPFGWVFENPRPARSPLVRCRGWPRLFYPPAGIMV